MQNWTSLYIVVADKSHGDGSLWCSSFTTVINSCRAPVSSTAGWCAILGTKTRKRVYTVYMHISLAFKSNGVDANQQKISMRLFGWLACMM